MVNMCLKNLNELDYGVTVNTVKPRFAHNSISIDFHWKWVPIIRIFMEKVPVIRTPIKCKLLGLWRYFNHIKN